MNYSSNPHYYLNTRVKVPVEDVTLNCDILIPANPKGIIIFSQITGNESGTYQAKRILNEQGFGVVTCNLLTEKEVSNCLCFDRSFELDLIPERLVSITQFIFDKFVYNGVGVAYWGIGAGADVALKASVILKEIVRGVACAEGRYSHNQSHLEDTSVPVLFLVSALDVENRELNKRIYNILTTEKKYQLVANSFNFLFEPVILSMAVLQGLDWFNNILTPRETLLTI